MCRVRGEISGALALVVLALRYDIDPKNAPTTKMGIVLGGAQMCKKATRGHSWPNTIFTIQMVLMRYPSMVTPQ